MTRRIVCTFRSGNGDDVSSTRTKTQRDSGGSMRNSDDSGDGGGEESDGDAFESDHEQETTKSSCFFDFCYGKVHLFYLHT